MSYRLLVYIAGCSYSGSTLLDMILGSLNKVTAVGEIKRLAEHFPHSTGNGLCTCGQALKECSFWKAVQQNVRDELGDQTISLADIPLRVPEPPSDGTKKVHRYVPKLDELLLVAGSRWIWNWMKPFSKSVREQIRTTDNAIKVLEAIAKVDQSEVIADSSKAPRHLKQLYFADPKRFRVIYLVRDGRGAAWSNCRRNKRTMAESAAWWRRVNQNTQMMMSFIPKSSIYQIRYEDLCTNPQAEIDALCSYLDIENTVDFSSFKIPKDNLHMVSGNPMRFRKDELEIKSDEKWKSELSAEQLSDFEKHAGKMNSKFGYQSLADLTKPA